MHACSLENFQLFNDKIKLQICKNFIYNNYVPQFQAISCHYAASDCNYIDVAGTSQNTIASEVDEIVKRRGVHGLKFEVHKSDLKSDLLLSFKLNCLNFGKNH